MCLELQDLAAPPAEPREQTIKAFPSLDMAATQPNLAALQRSKEVMQQALTQHRADDRILFLTEVHLNDEGVMRRLHKLFAGFEDIGASVIVMTGSFVSKDFLSKSKNLKEYIRLFDELGDLIASFPGLANNTHVRLSLTDS